MPVNGAPVANGAYYDSSPLWTHAAWYVCLQDDYDPDGDAFSIYWSDDTEFGTTNWTNYDARCGGWHSVTYQADAVYGYCYEETFAYYVSDTFTNESVGYVTINACPGGV